MRLMPSFLSHAHDESFSKSAANNQPLTPLGFLSWAATVYPEWTAVIYEGQKWTYAEFYERCCRFAGALHTHNISHGDVVAIIAPNIPAMLEAQFGVPMAGATVNPISPQRDVSSIAYMLDHGEAKLVLVDQESAPKVREAAHLLAHPPMIVDIKDASLPEAKSIGKMDYEQFLDHGSANYEWPGPLDEWDALALSYTLGTEALPKGVLLHHRGAFLDAMSDVISTGLERHTCYLWSLPIFRANGWCYSYAVTAVAGTHVMMRSRNDATAIYQHIRDYNVRHLSGKPGFIAMLAEAADGQTPLPHPVFLDVVERDKNEDHIRILEALGFKISFVYGMTESFGPAAICDWKKEGSAIADSSGEHAMLAHPAAHYPTLDRLIVADPDTLDELPADGESVGEIMLRGNTVFKGYHKDPEATAAAMQGGWFHTGDLGKLHPDGHLEIVERKSDVLVHGDNAELSIIPAAEKLLNAHPDIKEAVLVALPSSDAENAENEIVAFVVPRETISESNSVEIIDYCRQHLPAPLHPERVEFEESLPRNEDGEILRYQLREKSEA